jgi:hypothetical protein
MCAFGSFSCFILYHQICFSHPGQIKTLAQESTHSLQKNDKKTENDHFSDDYSSFLSLHLLVASAAAKFDLVRFQVD